MHLTPREQERLLLAAAADLARRRLARGAPLGATEAVALVCDEICELAWDGVALADVIERARAIVPPAALLPGVAALVPVLEVEALFPWGSTLVHVDRPFPGDQSQPPSHLERPRATVVPPPASHPLAGPYAAAAPGAVLAVGGDVALAVGAPRWPIVLRNTGHRDVWISSHYPLDQVNAAVEIAFADETARPLADCRLDLPAGEALPLRPGEQRTAIAVGAADGAGASG